MRRSAVLTILFLTLAGAGAAHAQTDTRRATLLGGIGNSFGWFGGSGELHLRGERFSLFGGLGYTPDFDNSATGVTVAAGARAFTRGRTHRGFLELSVSQLAVESGGIDPRRRLYGPSLQAGWQYTARGGFTLLASFGAGLLLNDDRPGTRIAEVLGIGIGHTWR